MDRDHEYYLKKIKSLLELHDWDVYEVLESYGEGATLEQQIYEMWRAGILFINWDNVALELDFE